MVRAQNDQWPKIKPKGFTRFFQVGLSPEIGLTNADLALARTWALGLPVALACPECGYYRDTPNHEFGCGR